ncbi:MAG: methyltransferase domain-containing protein [Lachnospiraceae bacterium]|nr:methyltransferase domain-containing protein [Lachnospiraceae bacterium]
MFGGIRGKIALKMSQEAEQNHFGRMLSQITKEQFGLEIGPSLRPCAPKSKGYNVEIVDWVGRQELVGRYAAMGLDTSKIEEVDYIWDGRPYSEVTGRTDSYDYIIASHVIEHVPDFIGFLRDCSKMLKMNGILSLAVPDKRYTLDHFRMVTTTGKVINDFLQGEKYGSVGALTDYWNHVVRRSGLTSWSRARDKILKKEYEFVHDAEFNRKAFEDCGGKVQTAHDFHQNVFTPASFELLVYELWEYGLIDLKIETLYDTTAEEFIVQMRKAESCPVLSDRERMELMRRVSRENVIL